MPPRRLTHIVVGRDKQCLQSIGPAKFRRILGSHVSKYILVKDRQVFDILCTLITASSYWLHAVYLTHVMPFHNCLYYSWQVWKLAYQGVLFA